MAIAGIGAGIQSLAQCRKEENIVKTSTYLETGLARALDVSDALLGITLIVLGVLALLNILPLPEGWGAAFAYGTMAAGAVNLLASAVKACQAGKLQYTECTKSAASEGTTDKAAASKGEVDLEG